MMMRAAVLYLKGFEAKEFEAKGFEAKGFGPLMSRRAMVPRVPRGWRLPG